MFQNKLVKTTLYIAFIAVCSLANSLVMAHPNHTVDQLHPETNQQHDVLMEERQLSHHKKESSEQHKEINCHQESGSQPCPDK